MREPYACGRCGRAAQKALSQCTGEGRAPVSRCQVPVWLYRGALQGLAKNTAQLVTLFALSDLWMVRKRLMRPAGLARG